MALVIWSRRCTLLSTLLVLALCHQRAVNGQAETESATTGSLFTTRSWLRSQMPKSPEEFLEKVLNKGCAKSYTPTCLKLDIVGFVDRLSAVDKYQIVPGLEVIRENGSRKLPPDFVASLTKEHPNDMDARLNAFLVKRLVQYLNTHSVNFKLFDEEGFVKARKLTELKLRTGRKGGLGGLGGGGLGGGGKDKGGYGALAAAGMMMGGTLGALAFGIIAALAGKALMTALMSLMLSAVAGLKGLSGGSKGVHYEIIQKPVYSHSHSHSSEVQHVDHHGHGGGGGGGGGGGAGGGGGGHHSGYGRSFDDPDGAHEMAYGGHQPGQ